MKELNSKQDIIKHLQKLEKRLSNVEDKIRKERKRGERRYWYAASSPLIAAGIWILIDSKESSGRILGSLLIAVAIYMMVVFGSDLEQKIDQGIFNSFSKLGGLLSKLGRKLKIRRET